MPKQFENFGISFLYPDNWSCDEEPESQTVMVESPEGAFLAISQLSDEDADPIAQAKQAMEADYDEIEEDKYERVVGDSKLQGVTLSFVYLDLIVTSHLLLWERDVDEATYFIQIQAEDRDMAKLESVFDAVLSSILQDAGASS